MIYVYIIHKNIQLGIKWDQFYDDDLSDSEMAVIYIHQPNFTKSAQIAVLWDKSVKVNFKQYLAYFFSLLLLAGNLL